MERIRVGEKVLSGDIVVNVGDDVFKVDLSSGSSVKLKKEIYKHISKRDKDIELDMSIISHDLSKIKSQLKTIKYFCGGIVLLLFAIYIL